MVLAIKLGQNFKLNKKEGIMKKTYSRLGFPDPVSKDSAADVKTVEEKSSKSSKKTKIKKSMDIDEQPAEVATEQSVDTFVEQTQEVNPEG